MDARGMKGSWEALVFYVNPEKTAEIRKLAADAQWFEDRMPWDPKYRKQGVTGITANAIDVVIETGDSGPITPVGINLPNDQDDSREVRQQVRVAVERQRGLRPIDVGRVPPRVRVDAGRSRARGEVEQRCRRADDQHARGHRPRVRARSPSSSRAARRPRSRSSTRRSRSRAPISSRSTSCPIRSSSSSASSTRRTTPRSCRPSTRATRATRSSSCGASARARRSKKTTCATGR